MKLDPNRKIPHNSGQHRLLNRCRHCLTLFFSLTILLAACAEKGSSKADNRANEEDRLRITLMDPYDASPESGLAGQHFTALKEEWIAAHPDLTVEETTIRAKDYSSVISEYASQNSLPDIFFIPKTSLSVWQDCGFLAEETEYEYTSILSAPILIVYDTELWQEAGYNDFPKTWEDLDAINEYFTEKGYDSALGTPTLSGGNASTYLMPRIFAENCGLDWMEALISGTDSCVFLEDSVRNALDELAWVIDSEVLTGYDNATDAYIEDICPAAVITLNELPRIEDSDKAAQSGFSLLPVSEKSPYGSEVANTYYAVDNYVLVISAETATNPDKLRLCVDFCNYILETEYDITENYSNLSILVSKAEAIPNYVYSVNSSIGSAIGSALQTWLDTDPELRVPEEIANNLQNGYEKYADTAFTSP